MKTDCNVFSETSNKPPSLEACCADVSYYGTVVDYIKIVPFFYLQTLAISRASAHPLSSMRQEGPANDRNSIIDNYDLISSILC